MKWQENKIILLTYLVIHYVFHFLLEFIHFFNNCRHFFFTAMLFVYGRILSQRLVNTVTSDKVLYRLVSILIKYHMVICYSLYIAGDLRVSILSFNVHQNSKVFVSCLSQIHIKLRASCFRILAFSVFLFFKKKKKTIVWILILWLSSLFLIGIRIHVVHSHIKEEDVQVSIWSVCLDTYDSDCCIHSVLLHCGKHF